MSNPILFVALLLPLLHTASVSLANGVNIDFGHGSPAVSSTYGGAAFQAGPWNHIGGSGVTNGLLDVERSPDPISIHLDIPGAVWSTINPLGWQVPDAERLLGDGFHVPGSSPRGWTVTLWNLDDGIYDVLAYAPSTAGVSTWNFDVNGVPVASIPGDVSHVIIPWISVTVARHVVVDRGTLMLTSTVGSGWGGLAGLQLVPVAVPEPSTAILLGLGLGWFGFRTRRGATSAKRMCPALSTDSFWRLRPTATSGSIPPAPRLQPRSAIRRSERAIRFRCAIVGTASHMAEANQRGLLDAAPVVQAHACRRVRSGMPAEGAARTR